jgi:Family of unknown function (DUF6262)
MPAEHAHLATVARRRHELARAKTIKALRELDHAGSTVDFQLVAETAGVSRSWLYTQPDLRAEIERLREATRRAPNPSIPAAQRAGDTSLLRRLEAALRRCHDLEEENQRLRRQLAHALGDARAEQPKTASKPNRSHRKPTTIEPRR